ncbi:MAG: hypothetical protein QXT77_08795 [Candidatus Methanomethylicaceae archaeon]
MKASKPIILRRFDRVRVPDRGREVNPKLRTQQQFKDECDLNRIVKNAQKGIPPRFMAQGVPQYGDFSNVPDLAEAHQLIQDAYDAFMNLPSQLRLELGNDPRNINSITEEQARRHGLLKSSPAVPSPSGQDGTAGTEPATQQKSTEGAPNQSAKTDG